MTFHILGIDQGTTSTRAIIFDAEGKPVVTVRQELCQIYPHSGWVEHNATEIRDATLAVCRKAIKKADIIPAAIGITNQRETSVIWDRKSGTPIANAIVWQDRRTADRCAALKAQGHEGEVTRRTGLLIDPYFSATKIAWMLDNIPNARHRAEQGELAFGTIDSYLLWHLTGGRVHATDATNASRTMLFNIHDQKWDPWLLDLFNIPSSLLPEVRDCAADFGTTEPDLFGNILPITGIAGDQHAATVGQACFSPGMIKSTYGTGCFIMMNTGDKAIASANRLITTLAYRLCGKPTYALEGSIFSTGSAVQWLRDGLRLITRASETGPLAAGLDQNHDVYMVPAFTGLGAPHWDPAARGALFGLTQDTGVAEIARAILEAVAYQTSDLIGAMLADIRNQGKLADIPAIRVDGGMVENDWLMQFLANILDITIDRPATLETTALGAACLAGLGAGLYGSLDDISNRRQNDRLIKPAMDAETRTRLLSGWHDAVHRTLSR